MLTRYTVYLPKLNTNYIFPPNYVRLNPEIQVLYSPISQWSRCGIYGVSNKED